MRYEIIMPIENGPSWIAHIEMTKDGNDIRLRIVKQNGEDCGAAVVSADELVKAIAIVR